jgi:hypothetical protein
MASYKKYDEIIDNQSIFDYIDGVEIAPGETKELTVQLPGCAVQIDVFCGDALQSLDGQRYGRRLLTYRHLGDDNYCLEEEENIPPVADAGPDQTVTDDDDSGSQLVSLDGTGSSDADGSIVSYVWTQGSTQIATGANTSFSFPVGVHEVTLTVTDNMGATDTDTLTITVEAPPNMPPVADAGPDQTVTDDDDSGSQLVFLDGSGSSDADGSIMFYVWTEGNTQIATGVNTSFSFPVGIHEVTLTVTDNMGATDTDTLTITVEAPQVTLAE